MSYLSLNIISGPSSQEIFDSFFKNRVVAFVSAQGEIYLAQITLVDEETIKLKNNFSGLWIGGAIYKSGLTSAQGNETKKILKEKKNELIEGLPPFGGFIGFYSNKKCGTLLIQTEKDYDDAI